MFRHFGLTKQSWMDKKDPRTININVKMIFITIDFFENQIFYKNVICQNLTKSTNVSVRSWRYNPMLQSETMINWKNHLHTAIAATKTSVLCVSGGLYPLLSLLFKLKFLLLGLFFSWNPQRERKKARQQLYVN